MIMKIIFIQKGISLLIIVIILCSCVPQDTKFPASSTISDSDDVKAVPKLTNTPFDTIASSQPPTKEKSTKVPQIPYPQNECSQLGSYVEFPLDLEEEDFAWEASYGDSILKALQSGVSLESIEDEFIAKYGWNPINLMDLTDNGDPEIVVHQLKNSLVIGCYESQYQTLLDYDFGAYGSIAPPEITIEEDMNLNGTNEVILTFSAPNDWNIFVDVIEWNGEEFNRLIFPNHRESLMTSSSEIQALYWYEEYAGGKELATTNGKGEFEIRDLDGNGTKEIILIDEGPTSVGKEMLTVGKIGNKALHLIAVPPHFTVASEL